MRRLFITLAKLLGLFELYRAVHYFTTIIAMTGYFHLDGNVTWKLLMPQIFSPLAFLIVTSWISWALLLRTGRVADVLGLPNDEAEGTLTNDQLVRVGIKLLGLALLADAVPETVRAFATAGTQGAQLGNHGMIWSHLVPAILTLVIAILMTLRTNRVVDLFASWERMPGARLAAGAGILLIVVLIIGAAAFKASKRKDDLAFYSTRTLPYPTESVVDDHPIPTAEPEFYVVTNASSTTNTRNRFKDATIQDVVEFLGSQSQDTGMPVKPVKITIKPSAAPHHAN